MSDSRTESTKYCPLQAEIEGLLATPEGQAVLAARRRRMELVAAAIQGAAPRGDWPLRRRRGIWFSNTQGQAIAARKGRCRLSVQMLGKEIGKLEVDHAADCRYLFTPSSKLFPLRPSWEWSRNGAHGRELRAFIDRWRGQWGKLKVQEREVQWQLAEAIDDGGKVFRGLSVVRWLGFPTEVATAMDRHGKLGTGTADLLLRRRGGNFVVMEVKRPRERKVLAALQQAIRYAVALHQEANTDSTRRIYRSAFGSSRSAELRFTACVAMEESAVDVAAAQRILAQFDPRRSGCKPVVERIGMLLYRWDDAKATVRSWKWLDGWDPRATPSQA